MLLPDGCEQQAEDHPAASQAVDLQHGHSRDLAITKAFDHLSFIVNGHTFLKETS